MYKFPPRLPEFHVTHELNQYVSQAHQTHRKGASIYSVSSPPPCGSAATGSPGGVPGGGPVSDDRISQRVPFGSFLDLRGGNSDQQPVPEQGAQSSAFIRCQDRLKRLNELNKVLESLAEPCWSVSENRSLLAGRLRKNKYFPALKRAIEQKRIEFLTANRHHLEGSDSPPVDLGLSQQARTCGTEAENELRQFRALEQLSMQTLRSMMVAVSAEVPLCEEEVKAASRAAKNVYAPAKQAFQLAVEKSLATSLNNMNPVHAAPGPARPGGSGAAEWTGAGANNMAAAGGGGGRNVGSADGKGGGGGGAGKRGHLSEEAVSVLQDWLVRNFDDPYPNEEEKARLVAMTGITLRQINNWMSNARVRIWRPAVENLHN